MSGVTQDVNKIDATFRIQANSSNQTTISYTSTTTPPKGLSTTAIVCIVLGVIAIFIVLCVSIWYLCRRRKRKRAAKATTPKPVAVFLKPPVDRMRPPAKVAAPPPIPPDHPKPHPAHGRAPPRDPRPALPILICMKPLCREYLMQLNVDKAYWNSKYDKCFCSKCHDPSNSDGKCGHWCQQHHGWVRFGLNISQAHQRQWNIFKEWKTSYYGTSSNRLASIVTNRFLPIDGDKLDDGTKFNSGHPDQTHCTTSPSLVCASRPKFTTRSKFRARDGTNYDVQLVLQCKQKPDAYSIHGDPKPFHNIEWKTETRSSAIPYALFVRLHP